MNEINTKELSILEMFSIGWGIFRDNFFNFFKITFILGMPLSILLAFANRILFKIMSNGNMALLLTGNAQWFENFSSEQLVTMFSLMILSMFIQAVLYPLVTTAIADAARDSLSGRNVDVKKSVQNALSKGAVIMISAAIYWIGVAVGMMFFVIPGIIMLVWWYFFEYAVIFDDADIIGSFKLSKRLVDGKWFKTAVYILIISIINNMITRTVSFFIGALQLFFIGDILFTIILFFFYTFIVSVVTVFYLNRKAMYIKNENKNNMYL